MATKSLHKDSLPSVGALAVRVLLLIALLGAPVYTQSEFVWTTTGSPRVRAASISCAGFYHTVRPGETIYSIAARYGSSAYRIAVCNGLRSYRVYVGQILRVPMR